MKVIVASKNPVKINAVKLGFETMFPNVIFEFEGVSAESGVSDQPLSSDETFTGAKNRAERICKKIVDADFWVGIERGLEKVNEDLEVFAWVVIKSEERLGKARTSTFFLPKKIAELIDQGKELGDADDIVFGHTNSKQKNGAIGILTGDIITRTSYYKEAVILALIPFRNKDLF
ncbi:inosine/xanthosine triphosphatase [Bacteroidota bacterium]